jgi:hypothetical protein
MLDIITETPDQLFQGGRPATIPHSRDLAVHFEKFVKYWAGRAAVEYLGPTSGDTVDMPVEVSVRWKGSVGGTLVIRCYRDFLKWLMESRDYKPLNLFTEKEIFHEMSTLYCVYLIQYFWLSEIFEMGLVLPRFSTPQDWPLREPDATCGLLVEQNPVEIRLWMD